MTAEAEILNLLYSYASYIDTGDLAAAEKLFFHARMIVPGEKGDEKGTIDAAALRAMWERFQYRYADGTPRTKHVIANPIIEIDEAAGKATVRSLHVVFQAVEGFPLQPIIIGRYHDTFERVDGTWRFAFRIYPPADLIGDMSRHGKEVVPRQ